MGEYSGNKSYCKKERAIRNIKSAKSVNQCSAEHLGLPVIK
jgi:hypothetical protein